MVGSSMSTSTRSGFDVVRTLLSSARLPAVTVEKPSRSQRRAACMRKTGLSSTIRMVTTRETNTVALPPNGPVLPPAQRDSQRAERHLPAHRLRPHPQQTHRPAPPFHACGMHDVDPL